MQDNRNGQTFRPTSDTEKAPQDERKEGVEPRRDERAWASRPGTTEQRQMGSGFRRNDGGDVRNDGGDVGNDGGAVGTEARETRPAWPRQDRTWEHEHEVAEVVAPQPAVNAGHAITLLLGMFLFGMGSVGLSRGGFEDLNLHGTVMGIPHTPLLGFMELVLGAIVILAIALPYSGRWVLAGAGGVLALFGLIVVIAASSLNEALGVEALNGWLYIVTGLIVAAIGVVMPSITNRTARTR